jgi:riboflavin kinase/FMN adenylyltransferase
MNIGTNPTVGGLDETIETYFLDFDADLYVKHLSIEILCRIREEKNFESVEALIEAMKEDEVFSRNYIESIPD